MIEVAGRTIDGRQVVSGVGWLATTHGVPLEVSLMALEARGQVPDWVDYIAVCLRDGHGLSALRSRIMSACSDVYGKAHADEVGKRVDRVFELLDLV